MTLASTQYAAVMWRGTTPEVLGYVCAESEESALAKTQGLAGAPQAMTETSHISAYAFGRIDSALAQAAVSKGELKQAPTQPMKIAPWMLAQRQSLPLEAKVLLARQRIKQWHDRWHGSVVVRFSGGADSTALLHLVRSMYPSTAATFGDTGLEFPEIREFVKQQDNITWIRPRMPFKRVIERYGYPVISKEQATALYRYRRTKDPVQKHRRLHGWPKGKRGMISKKWRFMLDAPFNISGECCRIMKEEPFARHTKETGLQPIIGTMVADSRNRQMHYLAHGCNAFDLKSPVSRPLSVWTKEDVWAYIRSRDIPYCGVYDMGYERTGCVFCMFGVHLEKEPNRFQRLKETHPKLWGYCMDKLGLREVLGFMGVPCE